MLPFSAELITLHDEKTDESHCVPQGRQSNRGESPQPSRLPNGKSKLGQLNEPASNK